MNPNELFPQPEFRGCECGRHHGWYYTLPDGCTYGEILDASRPAGDVARETGGTVAGVLSDYYGLPVEYRPDRVPHFAQEGAA